MTEKVSLTWVTSLAERHLSGWHRSNMQSSLLGSFAVGAYNTTRQQWGLYYDERRISEKQFVTKLITITRDIYW